MTNLQVPIDAPVGLKVIIILSKWIYELLCYLMCKKKKKIHTLISGTLTLPCPRMMVIVKRAKSGELGHFNWPIELSSIETCGIIWTSR